MLRRLSIVAAIAVMAAGCASSGGKGRGRQIFARKFTASGKLMFGLKAFLQTDKDEYVEGAPIKLMCALQNMSPRPLYLDSSGGWGLARIKVVKVGGDEVKLENKTGRVKRSYVRLGVDKGKATRWTLPDIDTPMWKLPEKLSPGTYKLTMVYDPRKAKKSEAWDKLSSAGGKYEGGELWGAFCNSNTVTITVKGLGGKE